MGFFNKLFRKSSKANESQPQSVPAPEQSVIVHFDYGIERLASLHALEDKLNKVISQNDAGEYDGHEIATDYSDGILYMYGPDAALLYQAVEPVLKEFSFMKGATAKLRFGPPVQGVKEIEVQL